MLNVPGEDVCASTPLINLASEGVLSNVLENNVSQVLLLFNLFISLQIFKKCLKMLFCCVIIFFF